MPFDPNIEMSDILIHAWIDKQKFLICMNEKKVEEIIKKSKDMGIPIMFNQMTRKEFREQVSNNQWEQVDQFTWGKVRHEY